MGHRLGLKKRDILLGATGAGSPIGIRIQEIAPFGTFVKRDVSGVALHGDYDSDHHFRKYGVRTEFCLTNKPELA